ncbi:MFS/sugar transport protein [Propionispira arboris]|uniref:MFS/sugar transport protein n=1 Tax=Propionispira arboris TaxID=84035 RepID=A0A1H6XK29_9FIRM|nr:MFS transporter [Propionispira arboris]SEJ29439.1 MFS/sugar transport protein [Propionispira arboris]
MSLINNIGQSKIKLSPWKKLSYATGDFANNFSWALVSSYLMFFWTDVVMIPAALCGTFMLVSKLWDAILDLVVGILADHTKSKWGHYRPWILFACIPMLIVNVLCFTTLTGESLIIKACYSAACYFILVTLYACVNNPYSALPAALTLDGDTRSSLASYRMTAAFVATLVLSQAMLPLVNWMGQGNPATGFFYAAFIFSALAFPFYLFCFFNTREVVDVPTEEFDFHKLMDALKKIDRFGYF